jgi:hypothetical protein
MDAFKGAEAKAAQSKRASKQFSHDFYKAKIMINPPAPPCLGEAMVRENLVNSILSLTCSLTVNCFGVNQKRLLL